MSLISTLFYGPEYAIAENFTRHSKSFSSIFVDSYVANFRSDVEIVQAMRLIYARQKIHETTYVTPQAQTKAVIRAGVLLQSRFSKSESPTDFYLVDHSVVVSKELTEPLYKIQMAARQRFESMYLSLIALSMGWERQMLCCF